MINYFIVPISHKIEPILFLLNFSQVHDYSDGSYIHTMQHNINMDHYVSDYFNHMLCGVVMCHLTVRIGDQSIELR